MQPFFAPVINHYHINGLHLFWDIWRKNHSKLSNDEKYISSLVQGIVIEEWLFLLSIFKLETKKNTNLLVELWAITWVTCILDTLY